MAKGCWLAGKGFYSTKLHLLMWYNWPLAHGSAVYSWAHHLYIQSHSGSGPVCYFVVPSLHWWHAQPWLGPGRDNASAQSAQDNSNSVKLYTRCSKLRLCDKIGKGLANVASPPGSAPTSNKWLVLVERASLRLTWEHCTIFKSTIPMHDVNWGRTLLHYCEAR